MAVTASCAAASVCGMGETLSGCWSPSWSLLVRGGAMATVRSLSSWSSILLSGCASYVCRCESHRGRSALWTRRVSESLHMRCRESCASCAEALRRVFRRSAP